MTDEQKKRELGKIDCKCWTCGVVVIPEVVQYKPLICVDCIPGYRERKFVFNRPTQEEMEELFSTKKGMTCM